MDNIQHRLLERINNSERITKLYTKLTQIEVELPTLLPLLLMLEQQEILIMSYKYYNSAKHSRRIKKKHLKQNHKNRIYFAKDH
jgi:hypothetical protein